VLALSHRVGVRRGVAAAPCVRALVHTRRGQFTEAVACLREAGSVYGEGFASDRHLLGIGEVCEAMVLLGRRDVGSALRKAKSVNPGGLAVPAFCLSVLGEAQVAAADLAGARKIAAQLDGHGPGAPYPAAVSAWINGLAARAAGEPQAASAAFGRAAARFDTLAMPYEAAISWLDWAEVIAASTGSEGERGRAVARATEVLDVLDRLRARPVADRARRVLRRLGVRPAAAPRTRLPGQLSPRETEIARLVAEGLSNPEIAERLFISQRTVTTHLQHIYQRLGVGSRTGLTRYVLEHPTAGR
jgi:DNA-binding CsgD family transcriptional regulator